MPLTSAYPRSKFRILLPRYWPKPYTGRVGKKAIHFAESSKEAVALQRWMRHPNTPTTSSSVGALSCNESQDETSARLTRSEPLALCKTV